MYYSSDLHNRLNRDPSPSCFPPGEITPWILHHLYIWLLRDIYLLFLMSTLKFNWFSLELSLQNCWNPSRFFTCLLLFWEAVQRAALAEIFCLTSECTICDQQIKTLTWTRLSVSVYCRGFFWRCALGWRLLLAQVQLFLWEWANVTTAELMMTVFCRAAGRVDTLRFVVRRVHRLSVSPTSVKSCLSAKLWSSEPLQLLLPLCDRTQSSINTFLYSMV